MSRSEELLAFLFRASDDNDDVMHLEELDGFLTGVVVCPERIPPSRWVPRIWSETGEHADAPVFESDAQIRQIMGEIIARYNEVSDSLMPGGLYEPFFDYDENEKREVWETWAAGFGRALKIAPDSWLDIISSGESEPISALMNLRKAARLATEVPLSLEELDAFDKQVVEEIQYWVESLADWRLRHDLMAPLSGQTASRKVGRNDPCPCGSGKKFKKCHGAG